MKEHPLDPGWEAGSYMKCHPRVRPHIKKNDKVIDVVVKDGKPIVRSAFVVSEAKGHGKARVLYFNEFYFADGEQPIELPIEHKGYHIQYRNMRMQKFAQKYPKESQFWERIEKTYARYKKGIRPVSIDEESWNRMKERATKVRESMSSIALQTEKSECR